MKEKAIKGAVFLVIAISFLVIPMMLCDRYYEKDFYSTIVDSEEKYIDNSNVIGYLAYGPYVAYKAGDYKVRFNGISEGKGQTVDIAYWGKTVYEGDFEAGKWIKISLPEDVTQLEFRVFYNGDGVAKLEGVTVRPIYCKKLLIWFVIWFFIVDITLAIVMYDKTIKKYKGCISFFQCVSFYGLIVPVYELIIRGKWSDVVSWMDHSFVFYMTSIVFLSVISMLIYAFCNRFSIAQTMVTLSYFALVLIGHNYQLLRGEPFELTEFVLFKEAAAVLGQYKISIPIWSMVFTIWMVVLYVLLRKEDKIVGSHRAIIGIISILLLLLTTKIIGMSNSAINVYAEENATVKYYNEYGYMLGLISVIREPMVLDTEYNKKAIEQIVTVKNKDENIGEYPNIIFIQNETLYDMSLISQVRWSEDPLAALKQIQENFTSGSMLSPMIGGGTCNVEYEALTGYPYSNTKGMTFNSRILKKGAISLVSILNDANYQTTAIHPNTKSFFNRDTTYRNLQFQNTVFLEDLTVTSDEFIGDWINDEFCYEVLINNYEKRDKSKPYFALVVTTQNHGAYNTPYDEGGITLENEPESDEDRQLQTFLNLEKTSVDAFVDLLNYFDNEENTIIVMWGDHSPGYSLFGMDFNLEDSQVYTKLHTTPIVIWNNYDMPREELGFISSYKISPYILGILGIHHDKYMEYMNENYIPNVVGQSEVRKDGQLINMDQWDDIEKKTWNDIKLLQYDRLFGKKYSSIKPEN